MEKSIRRNLEYKEGGVSFRGGGGWIELSADDSYCVSGQSDYRRNIWALLHDDFRSQGGKSGTRSWSAPTGSELGGAVDL